MMNFLLSFISVLLVFLFTLFLSIRWPSIAKIILIAFLVRLTFLLIGNYVSLPDSTADALTFELKAWEMSQNGFYYVLTQFRGPDPRFISWIIAIFYSLLDRSMLMAKSFSLFFGIASVFLGWLLAKKIWDNSIANRIGWTLALFPSLILYSVLVMREAYIVFFLIVALFGVVNWVQTGTLKSIILAIFGFTGATFFHGGMAVGGIVFLGFVGLKSLKKFFISLVNLRINLRAIFSITIFFIVFSFYVTNQFSLPYLGSFENSIDLNNLLKKTDIATRGVASWPEWTIIKSPIEFFYKGPIRAMYVAFSPFPWDVIKFKHLIGMFDGLLYVYFTFLIIKNRKIIWKNQSLKIILIILISYLFVFGIGVGNFGTGIRHRSKFVVLLIMLSGPMLKKIVIKKNIIIEKPKNKKILNNIISKN